MMRRLFLAALVAGLCTSPIMAQESGKAGTNGDLQNPRLDTYVTNNQDTEEASKKIGILNLHPNDPETRNQDNGSLPHQSPKLISLSDTSKEIGRRYPSIPLYARDVAGGGANSPVQCPPSCGGREYNRIEIYGGYSLLSNDLRLLGIFNSTRATTLVNGTNIFDLDTRQRFNLNGGDVSVTFNFTRYVGAQFDFSGHTRDFNNLNSAFIIPNTAFGNVFVIANIPRPEFSVHNFFGGVQVKDNRKDGSRARPFGHFLLGASRDRLRINSASLFTDLNHDGALENFIVNNRIRFERTSFAMAIGGGFDIRITNRFSIRPIKIDYLPVFARPPVLIFTPPVLPVTPIFPPVSPAIPPGSNFTLSFADVDRNRTTKNNIRIGAGILFHF